MSKMILCFIGISILAAMFGVSTRAQTINAASCSATDVQNALNNIGADGTTVVIPSGTCVWTNEVTYAQKYSFTLQGAGAVYGTGSQSSISGMGSDLTTLVDNEGADRPMLLITAAAGKSLRITGIHFAWAAANTAVTDQGTVQIDGVTSSLRVDHNHFDETAATIAGNGDLELKGCIYGVADHNQFDGGSADENFTRVYNGASCNGDPAGMGNGSWAMPTNYGSSNYFFEENNNFQWAQTPLPGANGAHAFAFDIWYGGWLVFRFNALGWHTALQTHGTSGGTQDYRGVRAMEIYGNTAVWSSDPTNDPFAFWVQLEGGTSYWWGNTVTGFVGFISAQSIRSSNTTYGETATPNGWGYCGTSFNGTGSSWDGNKNLSTGYPCLDGNGRGQGDLLTGAFPNKINSATGTIGWPNQALEPDYVWANTYNPAPQEPDYFWGDDGVISENVDYYLQCPNYGNPSCSFNGTVGVGQGPRASRPSTCTKGVAYWSTDQGSWNTSGNGFGQGVLDLCTATNQWTNAAYTPYTYPHPLALGQVQGPTNSVDPPTNLTASVQ